MRRNVEGVEARRVGAAPGQRRSLPERDGQGGAAGRWLGAGKLPRLRRQEADLRDQGETGSARHGDCQLALFVAAGRFERPDGRLGGSPRAGQGGGAVRRQGRRQPERRRQRVRRQRRGGAPVWFWRQHGDGEGRRCSPKVPAAQPQHQPERRGLSGARRAQRAARRRDHPRKGRLAGGVHRPGRSGPQRESVGARAGAQGRTRRRLRGRHRREGQPPGDCRHRPQRDSSSPTTPRRSRRVSSR